jgi:hypothetical protein
LGSDKNINKKDLKVKNYFGELEIDGFNKMRLKYNMGMWIGFDCDK